MWLGGRGRLGMEKNGCAKRTSDCLRSNARRWRGRPWNASGKEIWLLIEGRLIPGTFEVLISELDDF